MVKYFEIYKTATRSLFSNKVRSVLTMLGVIIGVYAVVTMVSLGIGAQNYIKDQFESLGSNVILVAPGRVNFADDPAKSLTNNKLDERHVKQIQSNLTSLEKVVAPSVRTGKTLIYKNKKFYASVVGTSEVGNQIFNLKIEAGNFLNRSNVDSKARVIIIGKNVQEELFGKVNPIGKRLKIEDRLYEVIGISKEKGPDFDDNVYLPYTTIKNDFGIRNISGIAVKIEDQNKIEEAMREIKYILLADLKEDDFTVLSTQDILESIQNVLRVLTTGIGAIAGISLLVGGIGIMNIMLVSVTERTKEIGLRKAIGASPFDITIQFMLESIMISVSGGMIGLLLGWLTSLALSSFVRTAVPFWAVGVAFGFSVFVGVLFGTYPAIKAGKKDPIEALRYE